MSEQLKHHNVDVDGRVVTEFLELYSHNLENIIDMVVETISRQPDIVFSHMVMEVKRKDFNEVWYKVREEALQVARNKENKEVLIEQFIKDVVTNVLTDFVRIMCVELRGSRKAGSYLSRSYLSNRVEK